MVAIQPESDPAWVGSKRDQADSTFSQTVW